MSETLQHELRATKPVAPESLHERVRALAEQEPVREPFLARFEWRRLLLVAPATLVVALVAAGVIGLSRDDVVGGDEQGASGGSTAIATLESSSPERTKLAPPTAADSAAVPPAPGRLQRYEAELQLRVDDVEALSSATKRAQQIALSVGGHVASLQYDAPGEGFGAAQLTLRVPTTRVQNAMSQLSALGTILGQRYGIQDLQEQADSLQAQIEQTQRQIASLNGRLRSTTLSDEERAVLQSRLASAKQKLAALQEGRKGTIDEARTATIFLTLTTEEIDPAAETGSRLDDVKDVLAWEAIALLYVLVIAGPFVLLGLLTWFALRLHRRREEARLLAK